MTHRPDEGASSKAFEGNATSIDVGLFSNKRPRTELSGGEEGSAEGEALRLVALLKKLCVCASSPDVSPSREGANACVDVRACLSVYTCLVAYEFVWES
jgi:hypothetical protein